MFAELLAVGVYITKLKSAERILVLNSVPVVGGGMKIKAVSALLHLDCVGAMTFSIDKKGASANNNRSSKAGKYLFADQYENVVHNACRFYGCHMRFFYRRPKLVQGCVKSRPWILREWISERENFFNSK